MVGVGAEAPKKTQDLVIGRPRASICRIRTTFICCETVHRLIAAIQAVRVFIIE